VVPIVLPIAASAGVNPVIPASPLSSGPLTASCCPSPHRRTPSSTARA
jgi:hypothetical protein